MKKAQKGNEKAFLKIFQVYEADIYRMAFVYVKNQEDALDIVQEVAYKSFDKIETLKEPAYLKTWLIKITINCSLNLLKQHKKVVPLTFEMFNEVPSNATDVATSILLHQMLDKLSDEEKGVVILKYFDGYSFKDISGLLQIPLGTAKSVLYRAIQKLRLQVEEGDFYE
ncbi:RNA polymerase sigma factor [Bacillus sp. FJAT-22090]|uniref:RNA polymerase sigma factor n=1 Tax=Bacillus sp. FJAT-22090 TaxID=1581038 RepID=UPI0021B3EBC3|nr:RNA polymerase sigma factor [Bacillus sp. FJAT-22090]